MSEFIQNNKKTLIIALIVVLLIATVATVFALQPKQQPAVVPVSSEVVSSKPTSSITVIVPEIAKPKVDITSSAASSETASSKATSSVAVSSAPVVDITASVDSKPAAEPAKKAESSAPTSSAVTSSKPQTPPEGDLMPQPNPDYAKPANRNMPSFTVDSSVMGPSGRYHGEFDGESYYHAGLDTWVSESLWFVYRFGQYPNATEADVDYRNSTQTSPFQQDGDFKPSMKGGTGDYYCKACNGWIGADYWEDGRHGSGRNHIANTKKMGQ